MPVIAEGIIYRAKIDSQVTQLPNTFDTFPWCNRAWTGAHISENDMNN